MLQVDDATGRCRCPSRVAPDLELPFNNDEQLIVGVMNVWRRTISGWCDRKAETEPSGGMSAFEFELCRASERADVASGIRRDDYDFLIGRGGLICGGLGTHSYE